MQRPDARCRSRRLRWFTWNCQQHASATRARTIVSVGLTLIGNQEILQRKQQTKSGPKVMMVREPNSLSQPSAHDGFIIVAVLWILIALAALASIYSIYIRNAALAVS